MRTAVEFVRHHLDTLWARDWAELERSIADDAELTVTHGDWAYSDWTVSSLYRHITQAWDFAPGEVRLSEGGDGVVAATMLLKNAGYNKTVQGKYRVKGDRICSVWLVDSVAGRTSGDGALTPS